MKDKNLKNIYLEKKIKITLMYVHFQVHVNALYILNMQTFCHLGTSQGSCYFHLSQKKRVTFRGKT